MSEKQSRSWHRPEIFLLLLSFAVPLSFAGWQALLNNFAIEQAAFTGREIGILQSLREIPGFLAFGVVFLLLLFREQTLIILALLLLGIGTALTGFFPSIIGLYLTTVLLSIGFHYYEAIQTSLAQQWVDKERAAETFGKLLAFGAAAAIVAFILIWLGTTLFALDYRWLYLGLGSMTILITLFVWRAFPQFPQKTVQHKHMLMRSRYWLYYALVFMSGARRQIFTVFAGFLMVEKFSYSVSEIALLFMVNAACNVLVAPQIGRLIDRVGERNALILEYSGLTLIFCSYALVETGWIAAVLYVFDHLFFGLAISLKTYFQKIAAPADIASTAGVSFTINHIAAVVIPVVFGLIWLNSHAMVFYLGAVMALVSLLLSILVPRHPEQGRETRLAIKSATY